VEEQAAASIASEASARTRTLVIATSSSPMSVDA
jgi:hypothetical protein